MKISRKKIKHIDNVVNSIQPFTLAVTEVLSNPNSNPIPPVDCYIPIISTYYCADQYIVSDEIIHSYDFTTSSPTDSVIFQGSKLCIGIYLTSYHSMAPLTPLNGSSSSVISGTTTPFSFSNMDQNDPSVKKLINLNHQNILLMFQLV